MSFIDDNAPREVRKCVCVCEWVTVEAGQSWREGGRGSRRTTLLRWDSCPPPGGAVGPPRRCRPASPPIAKTEKQTHGSLSVATSGGVISQSRLRWIYPDVTLVDAEDGDLKWSPAPQHAEGESFHEICASLERVAGRLQNPPTAEQLSHRHMMQWVK